MEENQGKNMWVWGGVVALVVVGIIIWWMNQAPIVTPSETTTTSNTTTSDNTANNPAEPTEDTSLGSVNAGAPAASISYSNALIKYKDARLQLDKVCQASPDKMTFKNGAYLMVDNHSAMPRTVKVGSTFSIKPFGFKIVQLSSATLPATWIVDCDSSQNVSSILIEK